MMFLFVCLSVGLSQLTSMCNYIIAMVIIASLTFLLVCMHTCTSRSIRSQERWSTTHTGITLPLP